MAEVIVKEELFSEEEETAISEEKFFLAQPFKIEYTLDNYEYKSDAVSESSSPKTEQRVAEPDFVIPIKEEMIDVDETGEIPLVGEASTSSGLEPQLSVTPACSVQGKETETVEKEDQRNEDRCGISKEVFGIQTRRAWRIFIKERSDRSVPFPGNIKPKFSKYPLLLKGVNNNQFREMKKVFSKIRLLYDQEIKPRKSAKMLFECDMCDRSFSRKSNVQTHPRIPLHTEENQFQCDECKKCFSQARHLKIYQKTHTGEKPVHCHECERSFSHPSNLRKHYQRMHTGRKPFPCEGCERKFSYKSSLKIHQRIHTGEEPYQCHECERKYFYPSSFRRHKRKHTQEKSRSCESTAN